MATGTQVPWTDPGGTPCCCVANCPDLGNGPTNVEFITATRFTISQETYVSLYSGGTMEVSLSGSASGTAVSVFNANITCVASASFNAVYQFAVAGNSCTFLSNSSNTTKISGTGSTSRPTYGHYLELINGVYRVFFNLGVFGAASQDCAEFDASINAQTRTINNGYVPPVGGAQDSVVTSTELTVELPLQTITVPTTTEVFGSNLFFSFYTNVSGSVSATYTWTPAAP